MSGKTSQLETQVHVYTDDDGHQHYDFIVDKEHMSLIKREGKFTEAENAFWNSMQDWPEDDFFKKAFTFGLLINLLHSCTCSASINGRNSDL